MIKTLYRVLFAVTVFLPVLRAQSIAVTPAHESVAINGTKQYTATVTGLTGNTVTWSVNGAMGGGGTIGSISSSGLYTAPFAVPSPPYVKITATSTVNTKVSGSSTVTIKTAGPVVTSISPSTVPVGAFTITVNGTGFLRGAAVWMSGAAISTKFVSATKLTASSTVSSPGTQTIYAANPGSLFSNVLTLTFTSGAPTVTVQPSAVSVATGATQQFSALINGVAQSATWAVTTVNGGSISSGGLYTAPASVPSPPTVTITATVAGDPVASATVTVTGGGQSAPTVTGISVNPVPIGVFTFTVNGTGFTNTSQATLGSVALSAQFVSATQLTVSGFASQTGPSTIVVSNGSASSAPFAVQVGPTNPLVNASAARHFLQQAAFGPTTNDAANVQQIGFAGWLAQQLALPKSSNYQGLGSQGGIDSRFLANAVGQPDQLRQKVAFALSQFLVVSVEKDIWNSTVCPYEEMLMADAFTNYRQILADVTLSPAMGEYLDAANNGQANSTGTVLPNENFAREVMQLFSIGPLMLKTDGTLQLDGSGNPIPAYTQSTVSEMARVFTGWTYAPAQGTPVQWGAYINPNAPMVAYEAEHDMGSKTLLSYAPPPGVFNTLAANQTAEVDLSQTLDNIFNHPNVGPFVSRLLIQHLVKSNPSPAYVQRVAAIFNSNQVGVRGDMPSVIEAILLDPEARQNDVAGATLPTDGHLQEPMLFLAGFLRAMGGQINDQNYSGWDLFNMSQDVYNAPSVFNFYAPNYIVPGYAVEGPEFQIYTTFSSVYRDNVVSGIFGDYSNYVASYGPTPGNTIDLTPFVNLAGNPATLVGALDLTLTNGLMPAALNAILVNAVQAEAGGSLRQVQTALYLLLSSGYYNVWN